MVPRLYYCSELKDFIVWHNPSFQVTMSYFKTPPPPPPNNVFMCHTSFNPILTGLFESKFLLGGGQFDPPLQISAPKGPIAAKFCMDVKTHVKSIAIKKKLPKKVYLLYYYNLCKLDASYHIFINISNK